MNCQRETLVLDHIELENLTNNERGHKVQLLGTRD